jgi:hypothetical protein
MKFIYLYPLTFVLLLSTALKGQYYNTDDEVDAISSEIVKRLNFMEFKEDLIVLDFTDPNGNPTQLGAYLADLMTDDLVNAMRRFKVKKREEVDGNGGKARDWTNLIKNESDTYLEQDHADLVGTAADGLNILFKPGKKDKRLKGIEAKVEGKITTIGEHYSLTVAVSEVKSGDVLATATGDFSNTPALSKLQGSVLKPPVEREETGGGTGTAGRSANDSSHKFNRMHLQIELLKTIENGRYVECHFRLTSIDKDTNVSMHIKHIRIFNQKNGKEYAPVNINIADITSSWDIKKNLIKNTPVKGMFSFEPGEKIDVISKLSFSVHTPTTDWFVVDMSDIFVQ